MSALPRRPSLDGTLLLGLRMLIRVCALSVTVETGTFWFIIRGIENYPVQLGDMTLPAAARLRLHRFQNTTVNNQLVTLADVADGTAGALFMTRFDASNPKSYGYLEACMRAMIDGATSPLFLSSGAEDYFLSAYYFNQGNFKTPESGLTYFDGAGTLSVYKVHDRDPVLWSDGFKLIFRNCETTTGCGDIMHCPNQFCAPNATAVDLEAVATDGWRAPPLKHVAEGLDKGSTTAEYKTAGRKSKQTPLATKILLEDTDGLHRPP